MSADTAKVLREAFPPEKIGKLPRVTCKECSQAPGKACGAHSKSRCAECGNYITSAHIHLDYVGHAAVTDRLLKADPAWTYELVRDPSGLPFTVTAGFSDPYAKVGLWIDLIVAGIRTPGFGEGKNFKEAISDAIRNAAMRRGVALDLWSKEDLHDSAGEPPAAVPSPRRAAASDKESDPQAKLSPAEEPAFVAPDSVADPLGLQASRADAPTDGGDPAMVEIHFGKNSGRRLGEITPKQLKWYAEGWSPNPQYPVGPMDRRLRAAARVLAGLPVEDDGPFNTQPTPDDGIPF